MPQVIVCGAGFGGGILVYDQSVTTTVLETYMFSNLNLTVHEVGAVIGFPGSYSHLVESNSLSELDSMRFGTGTPSLDVAQGYTLFAPSDSVFDTSGLDMSSLNPADVWNNHVSRDVLLYTKTISYYLRRLSWVRRYTRRTSLRRRTRRPLVLITPSTSTATTGRSSH